MDSLGIGVVVVSFDVGLPGNADMLHLLQLRQVGEETPPRRPSHLFLPDGIVLEKAISPDGIWKRNGVYSMVEVTVKSKVPGPRTATLEGLEQVTITIQ
jgi:hypothetical protein